MSKESDTEKRRKARARKKALAFPNRDKMIKTPPVFKAGGG